MQSPSTHPGLLRSVWPPSVSADSARQRRKKLAVRTGHLALGALVATAVVGSMLANLRGFSFLRGLELLAGAVAYIVWNFYGTTRPVRLLLWEGGAQPPLAPTLGAREAIGYFGVQLSLAGAVYGLAQRGTEPNLAWLALLPPAAYSAFLLNRFGIAVVTACIVTIFVGNVVYWRGWNAVPYALAAFAFALLFTLVFSVLAVNAENTRREVQRLATELGEANGKLREYALQVEELAATRERNRVAREIHDTLGHCLTVVNVQLRAASALAAEDPERARAALDKAQGLTQQGLDEVRRSVAALRTSPLDKRGLLDALRELLGESSALKIDFKVQGHPHLLPPQAALTLYRTAQEGLTGRVRPVIY